MGKGMHGKRILILRPDGRSENLSSLVQAHGASSVSIPAVAFEPPADWRAIDCAIRESFDLSVFTSVTAADLFMNRAKSLGVSVTGPFAAVGPATAAAITRASGHEAWIPSVHTNAGLANELPGPGHIALFRAAIADDVLDRMLAARGFDVCRVDTYRTVPVNGKRIRKEIHRGVDAVILTSASIARALLDAGAGLDLPPLCCIGAPTAAACRERGVIPASIADAQTNESLVRALEQCIPGGM